MSGGKLPHTSFFSSSCPKCQRNANPVFIISEIRIFIVRCMSKRFIILLLVTFGFFLMPNDTFACDTQAAISAKSCCDSAEECACEKQDIHTQKNSCSGEMQHSSCHCTPAKPPVAFITNRTDQYPGFTTVYLSFPDVRSYILSGFHFIWLPPKIS